MKRVLEQEGTTPEEAIEKALERLGVSKDKAKIEILDEGSKGLFGLVGTKKAKVKVSIEDQGEELAQEVTQRILDLMGIETRVEAKEVGEKVVLDIKGDKSGILIGKRGQTLNSLQYLVNLIINREKKEGPRSRVMLDMEDYRGRRQQTLTELAHRLADRVIKSGRGVTLEPMSPHERHIIHLALQDYGQVATRSVGEGKYRKIVIAPQREESRR